MMYLSKMVILHSYVKLPEGNLCNSLPVQLGPIQKKEPQLPPLSLPRLPSLNSGMRRNMYNAIGLDVNKDGGNTGNMETLFFPQEEMPAMPRAKANAKAKGKRVLFPLETFVPRTSSWSSRISSRCFAEFIYWQHIGNLSNAPFPKDTLW